VARHPTVLRCTFGYLLMYLVLEAIHAYRTHFHCKEWESGIFHPSEYGGSAIEPDNVLNKENWFNNSALFFWAYGEEWIGSLSPDGTMKEVAPLRLEVPELLRSPPILARAPEAQTYNEGVLCVVSNTLFYPAIIALLGLSFACFPLHCKTAGSTTLGAYLVQFCVPFAHTPVWTGLFRFLTLGSTAFDDNAPFKYFGIVLYSWVLTCCFFGPLFQWYVITPQLQCLIWLVDKLSKAVTKRVSGTTALFGHMSQVAKGLLQCAAEFLLPRFMRCAASSRTEYQARREADKPHGLTEAAPLQAASHS